MAVNTILIDFSVEETKLQEENYRDNVIKGVETVLINHLKELQPLYSTKLTGNLASQASQVNIYQSIRGALVTLRIFNNGLVTVNIEYYKSNEEEAIISYDHTRDLEQCLGGVLRAFRSKILPPVKRGALLDVYLTSSDERLLEYDIDGVIFEERTPFQKVQIVHSKSLGNMLVLDDLQNISESDLIYTETLMARGVENYKDKEICILGGGDGALLYELLKEKPKHVVMLEIDEVVMKACAKHMRSICGDVLDTYKTENYEIILADCLQTLDKFIAEGRKFDYVFGDLTDIPISTKEENTNSKIWDFILKILEL
ncbi:spermine synthase isoform X1 [Atheta coriaria]|uniref:spermine synthase isoform X1 n=1 Tax=Dalotia coriaria TaxID=877792 RepID=UPI0031F38597